MVKKIRYQENRTDPNRRDPDRREYWIFEPLDWAILAVIVALVFWLQWLLGALPA